MEKQYYEAYEDRYRRVHEEKLQWFSDEPTPMVLRVASGLSKGSRILELGCGEGRDARALLKAGYRVLASDISPEAIGYCRERDPEHRDAYAVLDCLTQSLPEKFDLIYAVALVHMLVEDSHRAAFYGFIRDHLKDNGMALVCSMGDGERAFRSDPAEAFSLQQRCHEQTGKMLLLPGTSCRMVDWKQFLGEISKAGLEPQETGMTEAPPDFPWMMYALVKRK